MQRRGFFGVLAGIGTFFGMKAEIKAGPITDLPIIQFGDDNQIINTDELFKNSEQHEWEGGNYVVEFAMMYLREQDVMRIIKEFPWSGRYHYGPVLAERWFFRSNKMPVSRCNLHCLSNSLSKDIKYDTMMHCHWDWGRLSREDIIKERTRNVQRVR